MTIAFRSIGTVGTGTTSVTPGLPGSLATGDGVLIFVMTKPDTATPQTPANWSLVADVAGGGGTTGSAVGPTRQTVFFREKTAGWSTMPAVTVTSGNSTAAVAVAYSKTAATWATAAATGTYGSGGTTTNAANTLGSNPGLTAGDMCVVGFSSMETTGTWSGQGISATGVSAFGTVQERSEAIETTTGNDVGGMVFDRPVTTGTSTANPSLNATATVATRGTAVLVRLREVAAPGAGTATGTLAYAGSASGAAGQAFSETFTQADGVLNSASWAVAPSLSTQQFQVVGNQVVGGTSVSAARWLTAVSTTARQFSEITYLGGTLHGPAVAMPEWANASTLPNTGTWYGLRMSGTLALAIVQKDDALGTYTTLIQNGPVVAAGDRLRLTWDGTTLRAYQNGTLALSHVPGVDNIAGGGAPVTPITGQNFVGIFNSVSGNSGLTLLDSWSGGAVAAAAPPGSGTASGAFTFSGSAAGQTTKRGTATGTWTFAGSATGKRTPKATGAGTWTFAGAAVGATVKRGTAGGSWSFTGAATGKRTPKGTAGGSWAFAGSATGKRVPKATSSGTFTFTGTAAGSTVKRGTGSGAFTFTGSATGATTKRGTASGAWAFVGAASGKRTPKASAAGSWSFAGSAVGQAPSLATRTGAASGTWTFAGAAAGRRAAQGTASGAVAYTGTATGARASRGTATGTWAYVGSATGTAPAVGIADGTATGSWSFTGTAIGTTAKRGTATGSVAYVGSATGSAPVVGGASGTATGTVTWAGTAAGKRVAKGTAGGTWLYVGSAISTRAAVGVSVGLTTWTGSAHGITPGATIDLPPDATYHVAADDLTLSVGADDLTLHVDADPLTYTVAADDLTYYVAAPARALIPA